MQTEPKSRGRLSNLGFILAAAGSAVGLGNLWKFPYLAGQNGGGAFVLVYLILIVFIGFTVMLGEMTVGRHTKLNPVGAYRKLSEKWTFVGVIGTLVAFTIVTYYSIIGGWILNYLAQFIMGKSGMIAADAGNYFGTFITGTWGPIFWTFLFIVLNVLIVGRGVEKGIETASKIMMPALFIIVIVLVIRSVTLPGAMEGLRFLFVPDFSKITVQVLVKALGQVFFSLSLGMGAIITYGSYLDKDSNLEKNALIVPALDTAVALLAGMMIMPAVFAFGMEPGEGPGLIFVTLPAIFQSMPLGTLFGIIFFILVLFAALSSSISLMEAPAAYFIDNRGWDRKKAIAVVGIAAFLISIPESLSLGGEATPFFGMNFFDFMGYIAESLLMPLAGLLLCIVIGYVWKPENAAREITSDGMYPFKLQGVWTVLIKYLAPLAIFVIWLNSAGIWPMLMKLFGR